MNIIIGVITLFFAVLSFIFAIYNHRQGNTAKGKENEQYFIAYLLIAAICFK